MCTQVIEQILLHQGLDPLVHFIDKIEEDNDDDETKEKEFQDVPGPSKNGKRVQNTNTKQSVVNMIKTIQDREDQKNAVLARQRANKRALQIFMEEGELEDSYQIFVCITCECIKEMCVILNIGSGDLNMILLLQNHHFSFVKFLQSSALKVIPSKYHYVF